MTKYAVIKLAGHQYKVFEEDVIIVDKTTEVDPEVLLVVEDDKVRIGKPRVSKVKVKVKKLGDIRGEKIDVIKYRAKSRYRKHIGFRPQLTKLLIEKIS